MKRRFLTGMLIFFGLLNAARSDAETIKIGYWIHKPHHYLDANGTLRGASKAYFDMMAAKMGVDVEWVGPLPFIRLLNALQDGSIDGCVHYTALKPGMGDFVNRAEKPFHLAYSVLAVRKDNPLAHIASIADIEGYRIGWLTGVNPSPFLLANAAHVQMDLLAPGDSMWEQSIKKLLLGRIDAVHELNAFTLPFIAGQMGVADQIKVLTLPEPGEPVFVVFSKKSPNGKLFLEKYNAAQAATPFSQADYEKLMQQEFETLKK